LPNTAKINADSNSLCGHAIVGVMLYDAFICHASEDKESFVRPLAEQLRSHHLEIWYDEFSMDVGDSLRESIDHGLANSRFGIVVLSPYFFEKGWPRRELNGLVAREMSEGRRLLLPIWHNVRQSYILKHSPPLADVLGVSTTNGIPTVVQKLLRKIRPECSPLVVARDFLIARGVSPPVISDESWIDLIEFKEGSLKVPDLNHGLRWIFPLPFPWAAYGRERGINIAWTALQLDWSDDGTTRKLCQLTHPDEIHNFLKRWPGLSECCQANPSTLAMYAPQLTIPGFDTGFEEEFDKAVSANSFNTYSFSYSEHDTVDGKPPLCGDIVAWRHPTFGNLTEVELARSFVDAHDGSYSRQSYSYFECFVWLLSDQSVWLPKNLRSMLMKGMMADHISWRGPETDLIVSTFFVEKGELRRNLKITTSTWTELGTLIQEATSKLGIESAKEVLLRRFKSENVLEQLFLSWKRSEELRKSRHR
jgi:hypothetical protein